MIHLLNIEEWAERYHEQSLSKQELSELHKVLDSDVVLNQAFEQALHLLVMLQEQKKRSALKLNLANIAAQHKAANQSHKTSDNTNLTSKATNVLMMIKRNWKPLAAAASIALFFSTLTYTFTSRESRATKSQYVLLKRDLETLKKSQNKIINDIRQNENAASVATAPSNYGLFGGSGFAISNDGYFATNYHVVEKADSIYLQMNNGKAYKASVIKVDPNADLAILKIEDEKFAFEKPIPYSINKNVGMLGQRIFSIGYPKDEVVYNEGYISSEKGFDGNALAYQLEITSNPGQSGAPILDDNGNVVGIITGKESNTNGTTFAVHSEQLLSMMADIAKKNKITINSKSKYTSQNRPELVKQLRDYVCSVRVY